jgi:hypothetical protein
MNTQGMGQGMRVEPVEIYSDASNAAVLRHPQRNHPGILVQGDTLNGLCDSLGRVIEQSKASASEETLLEMQDVHEHLCTLLSHYRKVLQEHGMSLPFVAAR